MDSERQIHIGTSGWHYDHWKGPWYPRDLSAKQFLSFYIEHFRTVEINNSFYRLPKREILAQWREATPAGFIFTAKASRYITHMKKLRDAEQGLPTLLERLETLGDKLGPILFQLPPRWRLNLERFNEFLRILPQNNRYAFEFRDPSWFDSRVYEIMAERRVAFCIYELAGRLSPKEVTAEFIYVRMHGPEGAYQGQYDTKTLAGWAGAFSTWANQGKEIFCYFDNDEAGYAARDAASLQEMISKG